MQRILLVFVLTLFFLTNYAQDVTVQSFNFQSNTRDTVIQFPDRDHNEFEKIIMHYGMRCKDALVSTVNERNRGCGEWDYSCNTYIVDSTRVDSLKQVSKDYVIAGHSGDSFEWTNEPVYTLIQRNLREVEVLSGSELLVDVVSGDRNLDFSFGQAASSVSYTYIIQANELALLTAGNISGLSFNVNSGEILLNDLKISISETPLNTIISDLQGLVNWQEVFYSDKTISQADSKVNFHTDFNWNGISNLAVSISYSTAEGESISLTGAEVSYEALSYQDNVYSEYTEFGTTGHINVSEGLASIDNEITISYWQYGADNLPVNTTMLEGVDASNRRQINVHHPWSNGQVYWDCGNDGNYDRINKTANPADFKGKWNHWAFTKNAATGEMHIYLNGSLWHSGTDRFRTIDAKDLNIGAAYNNANLLSHSKMSEFRLWNKALDEATIAEWMGKPIDDTHPQRSALLYYYTMDNNVIGSEMKDESGNAFNAKIVGQPFQREWRSGEGIITSGRSSIIPSFKFDQGSYERNITELVRYDSIPVSPTKVDHFLVEGTDLVEDGTQFLYAAGTYPIYDEAGNVVDETTYPIDGVINISDLDYFSKSPMSYEIMSFVTPYGIGLDFGEEGESWSFDVTDFGPLLKGKKRMYMSRGGEWQEEMDIWFEFVEGTPDRNVVDIEQVWPVVSTGYQNINSDWRYEPRVINDNPEAEEFVVKTVITGHGQQGEFEPRFHEMKIDILTDSWRVWTECAENPVYPQGGTWVYDRAGWCPGAASDTREFRITDFVKFLGNPVLDYNVLDVSGTSNYIVNSQLVSYGPINKALDADLEDVIYPSQKIEHRRFNPTCQAPIIVIKNRGGTDISTALIKYGIVGGNEYTFQFNGNVGFQRSVEVELDNIPDLSVIEEGDVFFAEIVEVNGQTDEEQDNNSYTTELLPVDHYETDIVIEYRTNLAPQETSYTVFSANGNIIHNRIGGSSSTTYRDTLRGLNGCYQILIQDAGVNGEDGISWWANGDGNGSFRVRNIGGNSKVIEPDFGKFSEYNFSAGFVTSTEEIEIENDFSMFPNPTTDVVYFGDLDEWEHNLNVRIVNQVGELIYSGTKNKWQLSDGIPEINKLNIGLYYVSLNDGKNKSTQKLIKTK